MLLSSCKPGQISMEDKEFGHGVFMHFVLEGLAGKADANGDQIVSLQELYKFAEQETKIYVAHKYSDVQTPRLFGEMSSECLNSTSAGWSPGSTLSRCRQFRRRLARCPFHRNLQCRPMSSPAR